MESQPITQMTTMNLKLDGFTPSSDDPIIIDGHVNSTLSYRDLQQIARINDIPCNLKRDKLITVIDARLNGREEELNATLKKIKDERKLRKRQRQNQRLLKKTFSLGLKRRTLSNYRRNEDAKIYPTIPSTLSRHDMLKKLLQEIMKDKTAHNLTICKTKVKAEYTTLVILPCHQLTAADADSAPSTALPPAKPQPALFDSISTTTSSAPVYSVRPMNSEAQVAFNYRTRQFGDKFQPSRMPQMPHLDGPYSSLGKASSTCDFLDIHNGHQASQQLPGANMPLPSFNSFSCYEDSKINMITSMNVMNNDTSTMGNGCKNVCNGTMFDFQNGKMNAGPNFNIMGNTMNMESNIGTLDRRMDMGPSVNAVDTRMNIGGSISMMDTRMNVGPSVNFPDNRIHFGSNMVPDNQIYFGSNTNLSTNSRMDMEFDFKLNGGPYFNTDCRMDLGPNMDARMNAAGCSGMNTITDSASCFKMTPCLELPADGFEPEDSIEELAPKSLNYLAEMAAKQDGNSECLKRAIDCGPTTSRTEFDTTDSKASQSTPIWNQFKPDNPSWNQFKTDLSVADSRGSKHSTPSWDQSKTDLTLTSSRGSQQSIPTWNQFLDQRTESMSKCRFGCQQLYSKDTLSDHERHCSKRPQQCPVINCRWVNQLCSLGSHILNFHSEELIHGSESTFSISFGPFHSYNYTTNQNCEEGPVRQTFFQYVDRRLFILFVISNFQTKQSYIYIQYASDTNNYSSTGAIEILRPDGVPYQWQGRIYSLNVAPSRIITYRRCLIINMDAMPTQNFQVHTRVRNHMKL